MQQIMVRKNVINSHINHLGASNSQASLSSSSFNAELSSSGSSSVAADSGSGDSKGSSTLTTKLPVSSHLGKEIVTKGIFSESITFTRMNSNILTKMDTGTHRFK
jgi:hypothetical protein